MAEVAETVEHGIQSAYYSNGPDGYSPVLECICGESYRESNWEDAGAELDRHLEESVQI